MRRFAAIILVLAVLPVALAGPASGEPKYPRLSGRVVDTAKLLSSSERSRIIRLLREHEKASTNQVVVVTLKSLQGYSIEEFGRGLGNRWGIGRKDKDNGVLLIVAPDERKVRIEVGRGLESILTSSIAEDIIENRILPIFKEGDMASGVSEGAAPRAPPASSSSSATST